MKSKEIQELKIKSVAELARLVTESNDRIRALRFDLAAGKVKNVNELRQARKKVARMKTFMKEK
jgi:ribosomal protein L29